MQDDVQLRMIEALEVPGKLFAVHARREVVAGRVDAWVAVALQAKCMEKILLVFQALASVHQVIGVRALDRVAQNGDQQHPGSGGPYAVAGRGNGEVGRGDLAQPLARLRSRKEALVVRPAANALGRRGVIKGGDLVGESEVVGFLACGDEDTGMGPQVVVQRGGAALVRADDQKIRLDHAVR